MAIALRILVSFRVLLRSWAVMAAFLILEMFVRPILKSLAHPRGNPLLTLTAAPVTGIAKALLWVERQVASVLSGFAYASLGVMSGWLVGLAHVAQVTYREHGALATDTLEALGILRHRTLPRVAKAAAAPALDRARVADRTARRSISLTRREASERRRSIDRLRKLVGPLAAIVLGIDVLVRRQHAARHHADHTRTLPRHGKELARHRSRLRRLEKALAGVLGGLIVYRVLARIAPWLFCRNWKVLGRAVCGMRPDSLANLLSLLLGAWALSDLRRTARIAEDALDFVTGVVWDAAAIGDRPRGRFTIE